jgi:vacuolar-type H+-ATPase subunit E/Vma4
MQEIKDVLEKIELQTNKKIEELKKEFGQKKIKLEQEFKKIIEQEKKLLEKNFEKEAELTKKRIYANNLIEYNKKIEEIKNKVISELLDTVKQKLLSLDKSLCYIFIKNILLHNLFLNEQNIVSLGKQNNLNKDERNKLLAEITQEVTKTYPLTKIEFSKEETDFEFGVKITYGKKSKEFTLQTFIDLIKPFAEEEVNKFIVKEKL